MRCARSILVSRPPRESLGALPAIGSDCLAGATVQLNAFCDAVVNGTPVPTPPSDSIANIPIIDAIYMAAGMRLRGG